jgi:hypothetical protein
MESLKVSNFNLEFTAAQARRENIERLLREIKRTAPRWAGKDPWTAEKLMQRAEQRELFAKGAR